MHPFISLVLGIGYAVGALLSIIDVTAVFRQSARLTFERFIIDDGSEREPAVEAFELSRRSTLLSTLAGFAFGALGGIGVMAALTDVEGQFAALALTIVTAMAADALRARHARLETRFAALSQAHHVASDSPSLA